MWGGSHHTPETCTLENRKGAAWCQLVAIHRELEVSLPIALLDPGQSGHCSTPNVPPTDPTGGAPRSARRRSPHPDDQPPSGQPTDGLNRDEILARTSVALAGHALKRRTTAAPPLPALAPRHAVNATVCVPEQCSLILLWMPLTLLATPTAPRH